MILSVLISASIVWFDMQNAKEDINNTWGGKTLKDSHTHGLLLRKNYNIYSAWDNLNFESN